MNVLLWNEVIKKMYILYQETTYLANVKLLEGYGVQVKRQHPTQVKERSMFINIVNAHIYLNLMCLH